MSRLIPSRNVRKVEAANKFAESLKQEEEKNRMLSKEKGHSMFLNLCGIYSYYKNMEPKEELELQELLQLDINIHDSISFKCGYEKGKRLTNVQMLESEIPKVEERINEYLEMLSKSKGKSH